MGEDKIDTSEDFSSDKLAEFFNKQELNRIIQEYEKAFKEKSSVGFNVFTMVSDFYYRETFHSDVIAAFLDPQGKHSEGNIFSKNFLVCLKSMTLKTMTLNAMEKILR